MPPVKESGHSTLTSDGQDKVTEIIQNDKDLLGLLHGPDPPELVEPKNVL